MRNSTPPGSARGSGRELYADEYVTILADADGIVVRMVRSAVPFATVQAMEASYMQVALALDRYGRKGRCFLVDTRSAVGRNDAQFDVAFRRARERMDVGLLRIAVLFRTATGMLQMMRLSEEDGTVRLITMNEDAALAYLRHGTVPQEARPPTGKNEVKR